MKYIYKEVKRVIKNIRNEHIGAFAAQSSFFFIMSFFPLTFLVFTVLKISRNGAKNFSDLLCKIIPYSDYNTVKEIFDNFVFNSTSVISVTTLLTAWSAGKGFYALTEGFHSVLSIGEKRNYIFLRARSLVYSIAFSVIIALLFVIGVFGKSIQNTLLKNHPHYFDYTYLITCVRVFFIVFILFAILILLYSFLPDWKSYTDSGKNKCKLKYRIFSALVSSMSIYIYTIIFSVYSRTFMDYNNIYGGISAFISIMLWLYGSMYIIILGFRLSMYLNGEFNKKT